MQAGWADWMNRPLLQLINQCSAFKLSAGCVSLPKGGGECFVRFGRTCKSTVAVILRSLVGVN